MTPAERQLAHEVAEEETTREYLEAIELLNEVERIEKRGTLLFWLGMVVLCLEWLH